MPAAGPPNACSRRARSSLRLCCAPCSPARPLHRTSSDTSSAPSTLPGSALRVFSPPSISACRRMNASTCASSSSCVRSLSAAASLRQVIAGVWGREEAWEGLQERQPTPSKPLRPPHLVGRLCRDARCVLHAAGRADGCRVPLCRRAACPPACTLLLQASAVCIATMQRNVRVWNLRRGSGVTQRAARARVRFAQGDKGAA